MSDSYGPHLLGRIPSPEDHRDYLMGPVLEQVKPSTLRQKFWGMTKGLDQGQTGHCVGFGWCHFGNCAPIEDHNTNASGHALYYSIKADIDHEPKAEDGSTVRSGAQELLNRGSIKGNYVFATTTDEITQWLLTQGPVVFGTNWTQDMFTPDANGLVHPTGAVEGGHCYCSVGVDLDDPLGPVYIVQQSWGSTWGIEIAKKPGRFKILISDMAELLAAQGEACAATEVKIKHAAAVAS